MNHTVKTNDFNSQWRPPMLTDTVILFTYEQAEIFTDVLRIRYSSKYHALAIEHGQEGCCTHSYRPLESVYNIVYKTDLTP